MTGPLLSFQRSDDIRSVTPPSPHVGFQLQKRQYTENNNNHEAHISHLRFDFPPQTDPKSAKLASFEGEQIVTLRSRTLRFLGRSATPRKSGPNTTRLRSSSECAIPSRSRNETPPPPPEESTSPQRASVTLT